MLKQGSKKVLMLASKELPNVLALPLEGAVYQSKTIKKKKVQTWKELSA